MTQQPPLHYHALDKLVFYGTVTITGASVMMVELLGTRIIGPYYGVSLVVWSSLLSVSLLALSIGYTIGGRLADRNVWFRLPHAVFAAGAMVALIPPISEPVQVFFNSLGLRGGALSSAFVLFTPPLVFLGMACPFVIRIATERLEIVGATAGNVYAISTVGSVVGTLVLGFFLLPMFGTFAILMAISLVLVLLSVGLVVYEHQRLKVQHRLVPFAIAGLVTLVSLGVQISSNQQRADQGYSVVYEAETHYGWVRVIDQDSKELRWLMSDASTIGVEHKPTGTGLLGYQTIVRLLPWFNPEGDKALLIGLGAGHLVGDFAKRGIVTDSIEIDPAVAYAAEAYFNLQATGKVIVGDGRYHVQQLEEKYDFIVHDCFTGGAEPFHLLSREMMQELKAKLKPGGILAINFVGFTGAERLAPVRAIAATLDAEFSYRRNFARAPNEEFSDYVFVVSDAPLTLSESPAAADNVTWLQQHELAIAAGDAKVITDDYNPLEYLQIAKAEYYRDMLVDRVGKSVLFR